MLELILIYFVGRKFYELSDFYNRNKWLFAVLGGLCYFISVFVFGMILGFVDAVYGIGMNWDNTVFLSLIGLPVGLLMCYIFYNILDRKWKKEDEINKEEINDIGKKL